MYGLILCLKKTIRGNQKNIGEMLQKNLNTIKNTEKHK